MRLLEKATRKTGWITAWALALPAISLGQQIVVSYGYPTTNTALYDITTGPDGALWFTDYNGQERAHHNGRGYDRVPDPQRLRPIWDHGWAGRRPVVCEL